MNEKDVLFTFDDYVKYLFPEVKFWRETQDLLLFRIYENLHEWLIDNDYVEEMEE
jgi:CRISPR-associated protein Cst1